MVDYLATEFEETEMLQARKVDLAPASEPLRRDPAVSKDTRKVYRAKPVDMRRVDLDALSESIMERIAKTREFLARRA